MGWSRPHPAASTQAKAVTGVPATPSKAASKTSRVMQQHWVPFEGLTADSARPVQLLDLVFLAGPGSRYVRLQLCALLVQTPEPSHPGTPAAPTGTSSAARS